MNGPRPEFLVIGAMKAGTTSLFHYLRTHPDLFLPNTKELNFFRDPHTFARGETWYRRQFASAASHQVPGEVSPDYTKHPHHNGVPERISTVCPDVKLIYLVRHPIDRMRSMYLHQVAMGRERRPIDVALLEDRHYLEVSQYAMQLDRYLRHFDRERILICSSEELSSNRSAVLCAVHRFVGVSARPDTVTTTKAEWYRGDERRRRRRLARFVADRSGTYRVFAALPTPIQAAVRRIGSEAVAPDVRNLTAETYSRLRALLQSDLRRFRNYAPEITDRWQLLD